MPAAGSPEAVFSTWVVRVPFPTPDMPSAYGRGGSRAGTCPGSTVGFLLDCAAAKPLHLALPQSWDMETHVLPVLWRSAQALRPWRGCQWVPTRVQGSAYSSTTLPAHLPVLVGLSTAQHSRAGSLNPTRKQPRPSSPIPAHSVTYRRTLTLPSSLELSGVKVSTAGGSQAPSSPGAPSLGWEHSLELCPSSRQDQAASLKPDQLPLPA